MKSKKKREKRMTIDDYLNMPITPDDEEMSAETRKAIDEAENEPSGGSWEDLKRELRKGREKKKPATRKLEGRRGKRFDARITLSLPNEAYQMVCEMATALGVTRSAVVRCVLTLMAIADAETPAEAAKMRERCADSLLPKLEEAWNEAFRRGLKVKTGARR